MAFLCVCAFGRGYPQNLAVLLAFGCCLLQGAPPTHCRWLEDNEVDVEVMRLVGLVGMVVLLMKASDSSAQGFWRCCRISFTDGCLRSGG